MNVALHYICTESIYSANSSNQSQKKSNDECEYYDSLIEHLNAENNVEALLRMAKHIGIDRETTKSIRRANAVNQSINFQ